MFHSHELESCHLPRGTQKKRILFPAPETDSIFIPIVFVYDFFNDFFQTMVLSLHAFRLSPSSCLSNSLNLSHFFFISVVKPSAGNSVIACDRSASNVQLWKLDDSDWRMASLFIVFSQSDVETVNITSFDWKLTDSKWYSWLSMHVSRTILWRPFPESVGEFISSCISPRVKPFEIVRIW